MNRATVLTILIFIIFSVANTHITINHTTAYVNAQTTTYQPITPMVMETGGHLKISIRDKIENSSHIFGAAEPSANGHRYYSLNSLGKSEMSPAQIMNALMKNPTCTFPFFDADGSKGQSIRMGNTYSLNYKIDGFRPIENRVRVTDVGSCYFTFSTLPGHTLEGSATHGILKDSTGELWLFQEGIGVPGEDKRNQVINYGIAIIMWRRMASNVKGMMEEISICGSNYSSCNMLSVKRPVNTGIPIRRGDKVIIRASGDVIFGPLAGPGGPEGISYRKVYNHFPEIKHGALIGKIGTRWFYIGRGYEGTSSATGVLELDVNDNDPGNNVGGFTVRITTCRP